MNVDVAFTAISVPVPEPTKLFTNPENPPSPIENNPFVVVALGVPTALNSDTGVFVPRPNLLFVSSQKK